MTPRCTPGTVLKNDVVLTATEKVQRAYAIHMLADSGGQGTGTLANKIKIVKIDADDNQVKLADAEFKITRVSDGREYTLKTDANGEAVSSWLRAGQYKLVETKAPAGYEADTQERLVTVQDGVVSLQTIENAPMKVSVNVKNTNRFLINFILKFMNFDVVLCYNKIDYVMEVGDSLSHF